MLLLSESHQQGGQRVNKRKGNSEDSGLHVRKYSHIEWCRHHVDERKRGVHEASSYLLLIAVTVFFVSCSDIPMNTVEPTHVSPLSLSDGTDGRFHPA